MSNSEQYICSAKILPVTWASDFNSREVALARSANSGNIKPMGGGIEVGESPIIAARRETFEESGLRVTLDRLTYVGKFFEKTSGKGKYPIGTKLLNYWYILTLYATEQLCPDDDVSEFVQCRFEDATKLLSHKNTASIYRRKMLPVLQKKYEY